MKKSLFFFIAIMLACLTSAQVQITEAQALQRVKIHRNVTKADTVNYYIGEVSSVLNETYCQLDSNQLQKSPVANFSNLWLVFADENPRFSWTHGCSYYYIPKTVNSLSDIPIFEVKGKLPPKSVRLRSIEKNLSINTPSRMPLLSPMQITPLPSNFKANDTQVIIIMAGDYFERPHLNWTCCSNLFNILNKKYLIPKQNFTLLMCDAYEDEQTGLICTYSHDLDGDNIDEDIIVPTIVNIDSVFESKFQDEMEHLFVFYVGYSDYDPSLGHIFIHDIPDYEWSYYIGNVDATYKNLVFCCNMAEIISEYLLDSNMTITVSNPADYYSPGQYVFPFDFAKKWIDGLAGMDMDTGLQNQADTDGDCRTTINELYNFAKNSFNEGCPIIHSQPNYLKNKFSFNYFPIATDLYIADNAKDKGLEPNFTSDMVWDSPDIWVRNMDDGLVNQTNEHLFAIPDSSVYIYVRISNFGYSPSYISKYLNLFWSASTLDVDKNTNFATGTNLGGKICAIPVASSIASNGSVIFKYKWTVPAQLVNQAIYHGGMLDLNIFAYLTNSSLSDLPTTQEGLISFAGHKNLAAKKHISMLPDWGQPVVIGQHGMIPQYGHELVIPIFIKNAGTNNNTYSLELLSDATASVFSKCTYKLKLSPTLYSSWVAGGSQGVNISANANNQTITLNSANSKIQNLSIAPNQLDSVLFHCVHPDYTPIHDIDYGFSIVLRDTANRIIEGETFDVFINGSTGGGVIINQINGSNGSCQLVASGVTEPSRIEWYGSDNEQLGGESVLCLNANRDAGEYKLRVVSLKDAMVSYATLTLDNETAIENVSPNPFNSQFTVRLAQPATVNMTVRLAPISGGGRTIEVPVAAGVQEIIVSAIDCPSGVYVVGLYQNGTMIENRRVIKQ